MPNSSAVLWGHGHAVDLASELIQHERCCSTIVLCVGKRQAVALLQLATRWQSPVNMVKPLSGLPIGGFGTSKEVPLTWCTSSTLCDTTQEPEQWGRGV